MEHKLDILEMMKYHYNHVIAAYSGKEGSKYIEVTTIIKPKLILYVVYVNDSFDPNNFLYYGDNLTEAVKTYNSAFKIKSKYDKEKEV